MNIYPPGSRIAGRYEVAGRPLQGGMGIVYVCFDHEEQRPVALKTFKPEFLPDRAARDRFLREGTTWVDLGAHPHVVRAYGVERIGDGREVYLVLELIAKEQGREDASLRSWLSPGQPLPLETALLFALQIARGMKHATERIPGFVHRDLKPENVLVGADKLSNANVNRLRVTDFGLASVLQGQIESGDRDSEPETRNTEYALRHTQLTHGIVGTPLYMAPEQWRGEPVSVATDVYALGCILYEMLAGRQAVEGRSLEALRLAHCEGQVGALPGGLPAAASELVGCCLALEAGARYGDWESVAAALEAAYHQAAGQAAPEAEAVQAAGRAERVAAGWSYNAMGASYLDMGKAEVARQYFSRAAEAGRAEGERQLEGAALSSLGTAYLQLGDARRAIGYFEQALVISREIGDRHGEGTDLCNLGIAYKNLGDAQGAIGYYEQALAIHREIGDRYAESADLSNLGNAYRNLGDIQQALTYHEGALTIRREIGDRHGEGNDLSNLGNVYAALKDVERAINCHEQALAIRQEIGDRHGEANDLGNLGGVYLQLGEVRRAISYLEEAMEIRREIGDRRGEGIIMGNLGIAYSKLSDTQKAIGHYKQALAILREIGDMTSVAPHAFNMARLYAQQNEVARALPLAQEALQIWGQIGSPNAQRAQQLVAQLQGKSR